ncbi:Alpha/Beta hydrolase protein [Kockovaella imperatae]|uniref:sterol esterase n=1 Tax=Kockovaella imperatae TaxID=4999 RepID=A0A1Y1UAT3_9TREE|nr:Alpha/Beta hydrolase protein [Kockovaella imperatae]ORX35150.1 Alpha/Beta hydrolase protein [Kockovaella imperatae]
MVLLSSNSSSSSISILSLTSSSKTSLDPYPAAPLASDPSLVPSKYLAEDCCPPTAHATGVDLRASIPPPAPALLVRAPPSQLMDAPARAALGMPNSSTAASQARAVRGEPVTPEYEVNDYLSDRNDGESQPLLLAPTAVRPGLSRSSSNGSTSSARNALRRIFIDRSNTPSQHLSRPTFPPPSLTTYSPLPTRPLSILAKINLFINQSISVGLSTFFLAFVVLWAMTAEVVKALPKWLRPVKAKRFPWDDDRYWKKEGRKVSKEPKDYARQIGMDIENQVVETEDGYLLRMHRVIDPEAQPRSDGRGGFPVLILHGLFQCSGSFVTSEERSLAFWLAKQGGYQVYLGNTRGIFDMGHKSFSRNDPRFWDWTIRELAMYDLPALVDHVCKETGYEKIAFIGHSQGNGLTFISLSLGMCPSLGTKMSVFIALAPAVYAGPLTTGFPFTTLNQLEWSTWKRFFGVLDFIPLMRWAYDYAPPSLFAALGYTMFAFLFSWTDTNWLHRRKTKMFRFTPTPVSSASIFWWCGKGGFADRKCTLDDTLERWFDDRFPSLSIYHGGKDYLVLAEPLLERLKHKEKDVKVIKVTKLDESEHCDFYWAAEAVEWAYMSFLDDIESTRPKYPEEMQEGSEQQH